MHAQQDGVVAYPVMQVYGSLALEEVGEAVLGRCTVVFPASVF